MKESKTAISQQCAAGNPWEVVLARKPDPSFVYAVTTTGIFCRSTCPSRRPSRSHVVFFASGSEARSAGFRACLRCSPEDAGPASKMAAQVVRYLATHLQRVVTLSELAAHIGCSPFTVQRVFTKVMGVSPRAYANAQRAEQYRASLHRQGERVTDAVYSAGFSAPSRARHAAPLGMAPKVYKAGGRGERIGYLVQPLLALGTMLVAATQRGVCAVLLGDNAESLRSELGVCFPAAVLHEEPSLQAQWACVAHCCDESFDAASLPLDLRGTAFQARVWAALQSIPRGETRSYAQLAAAIGSPSAVRAVASACARNPVALAVPCHRVIGSNGKLTGYRWGVERKQALLSSERADRSPCSAR
jgi:AraC family transcriptional regulator of adaptative response/methylated-DNA-[protein]-cysteine methyltransferase